MKTIELIGHERSDENVCHCHCWQPALDARPEALLDDDARYTFEFEAPTLLLLRCAVVRLTFWRRCTQE
jgi:hypothetical protein